MKFREDRPFASVDAAVKKLLEIANGLEPDHAGRIHVGAINALFMSAGRSPDWIKVKNRSHPFLDRIKDAKW